MKYTNTIVSSSIGNVLEWYDFGLFTIFSALFGRLFFPVYDQKAGMIATFGVFAVGFLCRPIGALIFGYLGDRTGRAKTLRLSILMITLPTLLIGFLPTYDQIGIFAPTLLIIIRMLQGISIGGEYSGNLIYLAETAPTQYRAAITACASMGSNIGILLAAIVGIITTTLFTPVTLDDWGWRIPYVLSGLLGLFIYYYRLNLKETSVFKYLRAENLLTQNPIKTVFKYNLPQLLRTLGLVCMGTTFYYFCFIFLPLYLRQQFTLSIRHISILMSCLILLMIILIPLAGLLCDKFGRKKMLVFNATFIFLIIVPGFYLLNFSSSILIIFTLVIFTFASSLEQGTTSVAIVENFPPPARYTGVSFGYNLGNGLLGGTVPFISEWLFFKTNLLIAPALYIAICAGITLLVSLFFVKETKGINLTTE
ncbi:MAG: MFS transporter [Gammaproteobacteria bacterium]|nr:MFS transporter [Gammaproteobacteria bacterium]